MDQPWKQVNITYPSPDPRERERQAVDHLSRVLPAAEAGGLITSWWFIRKGPWRVRYLLTDSAADPLHRLLTDGVAWTGDIYEPEIHAFGGTAAMTAAHTLFHRDSRHLLTLLRNGPTDRRERSLVLCTALMRTAGLEWGEQGDVWARIAEQRAALVGQRPDPHIWTAFTRDVRHLLLGAPRTDAIDHDWLTAFTDTGATLRTLREHGDLTRGLRAVIAQHLIFHWNRFGLTATTQATLAQAAKEAIFGAAPAGPLDRPPP